MIITAVISGESPRYKDWIRALGTDQVRIQPDPDWSMKFVPRMTLGRAPGLEGGAFFYHVDVPALTPKQRAGIITMIVHRFGEDPAVVDKLIDDPEQGIPVLVNDVDCIVREKEKGD